MRALLLMLAVGCASAPPLRPIPMEDCSVCSWAHVVRMNEAAIDAYDRRDFDGAVERFARVNAYGMSPRGFFNLCLALYRSDEITPDPGKLERACQACMVAYTVEDLQMVKVKPHLERLLGMIDATAKRRNVALTCDRSKAR